MKLILHLALLFCIYSASEAAPNKNNRTVRVNFITVDGERAVSNEISRHYQVEALKHLRRETGRRFVRGWHRRMPDWAPQLDCLGCGIARVYAAEAALKRFTRRGEFLHVIFPTMAAYDREWVGGVARKLCQYRTRFAVSISNAGHPLVYQGMDKVSITVIAHELAHLACASHIVEEDPPTLMHPSALAFVRDYGVLPLHYINRWQIRTQFDTTVRAGGKFCELEG